MKAFMCLNIMYPDPVCDQYRLAEIISELRLDHADYLGARHQLWYIFRHPKTEYKLKCTYPRQLEDILI